jgi:hypothetical protein
MNAQQVVKAMIEFEFKGGIEPDAQREIRDARIRLQAACNAPEPDNSVRPHGARDIQPSRSERIEGAMERAQEVVKGWGHKLPAGRLKGDIR